MLKEVLTVSALIAVVLLVRAIFKNRVPKRMLYALWLVVLFEPLLAGNTGFSAGSSGRGRGSSGAERRAARADCTGDSATRTNRDETANTCAATGLPGTRNCETGCKAVDDGTDSSNCPVQRQRIARTLAVRRVGGVYDSAAPRPAFFSASAAERASMFPARSNRRALPV